MSKEFVEYITEMLEPFGNIKTRKMFGGYAGPTHHPLTPNQH
jgi:TfoX/Sxy family transcriptional regulator of competence genes